MASRLGSAVATLGFLLFCAAAEAADPPPVKLALSFKPVQKNVEMETPAADEFGRCQVKVERKGKSSGWVVYGPAGQTLRRYIDTNGDNVVDQWQYFQNGLEVYRDIDSNFNNKVDQSRWLNMAGSRWGLDTNEDGKIDVWKAISAEEASREVVQALVAGNEAALSALLVNADDLKSLGLNKTLTSKILEALADPAKKMRAAMTGSKTLTTKTRWMRFDSLMPSTIPADEDVNSTDLTVYENAMAIVETGGKSGLLQIGEMVLVGKSWKLTQIPQPLEGNSIQVTIGGFLMQPALAGGPAPGDISPEVRKLLLQLQKLDANSPTPTAGAAELTKYNIKRADLLADLTAASATVQEREQWTRQMVDGIAAAVQSGTYPKGIDRLATILSGVRKTPGSPLVAFVTYRQLLADFSLKMQNTPASKRPDVQKQWLKELKDFAGDFPKASDTPDAMLQLAIAEEFGGEEKAARAWYDKVAGNFSKTEAGARATGAIRRLDLIGKPFRFSASSLGGGTINAGDYRGKVLLVLFWSTWCKPCTEDLPQINELYKQYRSKGFEIVGINLDSTTDPVGSYLKQHKVTWPQIHEPGGLDSRPAREFGIISLPTMFVIDKTGKTIARNTSVDDLKKQLPELLMK